MNNLFVFRFLFLLFFAYLIHSSFCYSWKCSQMCKAHLRKWSDNGSDMILHLALSFLFTTLWGFRFTVQSLLKSHSPIHLVFLKFYFKRIHEKYKMVLILMKLPFGSAQFDAFASQKHICMFSSLCWRDLFL